MVSTGNSINRMRMADYSPEKAGVGGSIPSLATIKINSLGWIRTAESSPLRHQDPAHLIALGCRAVNPSGLHVRLTRTLMIGRHYRAALPLVVILSREKQRHSSDQGIAARLRETQQ